MTSPASDFFGTDFSVKEAIVPDTPAPAAPVITEAKGALGFFGKDFAASNSPPDAPRNVPKAPTSSPQPTSGEWSQINAQYAQGASKRSQSQLEILQQELAVEKRPEFIASLKREISRVQGK